MAAEPETGLITDCEMTMAAGPGSTDAENGVKMAARDRFCGHPTTTAGDDAVDAGVQAQPEDAAQMPARDASCHGGPAAPATAAGSAGAQEQEAAADAARTHRRRRVRVRAQARRPGRTVGWRSTATPPTAAGKPAPPTATPATTR